ncbi:MAG: signal peptidase I [Fimbriimonadales bacterium]
MQIDLTKLGQPEGETSPKPKKRRGLINLFSVVLLLVLLFLVFFYQNFQTVQVSGESMLPTFHNGQRILICKALWLVGPLQKRDIVVIKGEAAGEYIVKRVAYLEGDEVDYVNQPSNWDASQGKFVVPNGTVYVLGDNEEVSEDSRIFGPVSLSRVVGKVLGD